MLRIDAAAFGASLVDELKSVFENFPGEAEVMLEMETREGTRRLRFGDELPGQALARRCDAELDALLGIERPGCLSSRSSAATVDSRVNRALVETSDWRPLPA